MLFSCRCIHMPIYFHLCINTGERYSPKGCVYFWGREERGGQGEVLFISLKHSKAKRQNINMILLQMENCYIVICAFLCTRHKFDSVQRILVHTQVWVLWCHGADLLKVQMGPSHPPGSFHDSHLLQSQFHAAWHSTGDADLPPQPGLPLLAILSVSGQETVLLVEPGKCHLLSLGCVSFADAISSVFYSLPWPPTFCSSKYCHPSISILSFSFSRKFAPFKSFLFCDFHRIPLILLLWCL